MNKLTIELTINGEKRKTETTSSTRLLDLLRDLLMTRLQVR